MKVLTVVLTLLVSGAAFAADITLPKGFRISVYADDVPSAREMVYSPAGTLYVGSKEGAVYALKDTNGDFRADKQYIVADGLRMPVGVDMHEGALYVSAVSKILRFPFIDTRLNNPPKPEIILDTLPTDRWHGWKFIRFSPEGKLFVPVGAPCNVCTRDDTRYATILQMNPDGTDVEIFASGVRNTVGFDWNPADGVLWFTDNGRDMLGDDLPPDELNRAEKKGLFFGFPYVHGKGIVDPEYGNRKHPVVTYPEVELGAHVASLGMRFYTGKQFPAQYRGGIFIAEHGSWNRSTPVGYRITFVAVKDGRAVSYSPFAEGWLGKNGTVSGRPADVELLPDGSLLVSDDYAGKIYRISYEN